MGIFVSGDPPGVLCGHRRRKGKCSGAKIRFQRYIKRGQSPFFRGAKPRFKGHLARPAFSATAFYRDKRQREIGGGASGRDPYPLKQGDAPGGGGYKSGKNKHPVRTYVHTGCDRQPPVRLKRQTKAIYLTRRIRKPEQPHSWQHYAKCGCMPRCSCRQPGSCNFPSGACARMPCLRS